MTDAKLNATLAALEALPDRTRAVFVLHRYEGWPYSRIAKHLGVSTRAAERRMQDALTALCETLDGATPEP